MTERWSIRAQLIALMLAIIVPLAALGAYSVYAQYQVSSARSEGNVLSIAELTAANLEQFLTDARNTLVDLSELDAIRSMEPEACRPILEPLGLFLPQYTNIFVTDMGADLVCSAIAPPDILPPPPAEAEWFRDVVATGDFALGKPHIGTLSDLWTSVLAYPLRADDGTMVGVVAVSLDLVRVQDLLVSPALPPGAVITIDDLEGTVVARSLDPEAWVGRQLPPSDAPQEYLRGVRGITRGEGAEGLGRVWGFAQVPKTTWRVWAGFPTEWVYAPVRAAALRNLLLGSLVFLVVALMAFLFYRRIGGALSTLVDDTLLAAKGKRDAISVTGPTEVVQVAKQFNQTLEARGEAVERLRQAEERYRSIMENAAFGIYVSTPAGVFLEVNPALVEMLGYDSTEELRAVPVPSLYLHPQRRSDLMTAQGDRFRIEPTDVTWLRKDGTPILVRLNGNVIHHGSAERAYEVIAEDISERRRLEEELRHSQKMEAVGRIAGGVAHDFNNLLTVITAEADVLLEALDPENGQRQGVAEVLRAADRAAVLTRQLLAFSRKSILQPKMLDLNDVLRETDAMLARAVGSAATLQIDCDPGLHPVYADPGQIHQILMNLVVNARDALGGDGAIVIRTRNVVLDEAAASARIGVSAGTYVSIAVEDNGSGIPLEIRSRLFEPFFTTKPEGQGTGLGLATVYGIVTQSGGHVEVESELGRGSTFTVFLPASADALPARASEPARGSTSGKDGGSETILVAEDEDAVRRVVVRILRRKGYGVLEASDGEEALEMAQAYDGPLHLLLTDVVMPRMQGPELAEQVLALRPGIRVMLMSGHTENPRVRGARLADAFPFLPKPFNTVDLLREVRKALGDSVERPVPG